MSATETRFVGAPVKRKEDGPLLTGRGTYVDNLDLPGTVAMVVVRSPYAHARIGSIDVSAARAAEGVVAVYTAADLRDDWKAPMPCAWPVTEDMKNPPHYPLADSVVNYQGDGVAVVVADTRSHAIDAAELVEVDYEPLPAVVDVEQAARDGAPLVHEDLGTNVSYVWKLETDAFDAAVSSADVVVTRRYYQPPLIPNAMETRGVVARPEPGGDVTLWSATQIPHILRVLVAATLGMPETKLRVVAPDVGGGFGSKLDVYAEELLAVALARRLGSPVKWIEERSENAVATIHGRDFVTTLELAATKDGKITAIRANVHASMGAYLQLVTPGVPLLGAWIYAGPYAIPNYSVTFTGVFTNTTPTDAYRGAGRPEATYVLERTMDALARELGIDRLELRRRNFIAEFPAQIASGLTIDSGDYHASLDRLLEVLDLDAIQADQAARRERGDAKQIGVGFSTYNEMCGLAPSRILGAVRYAAGGWETATVRCLPTGTFQVVTGTSPHGQGHETAWSQIVADQLGCDPSEVEVLHGDTSISHAGLDTYGSRSLPVGGAALFRAGEKIVEKARDIVAHQLEVSADDLEYDAGTFTVKGSPDKSMTIKGAAWAAFAAHNLPDGMEPGLEATATYDPKNFSWPGGAHAAVVEVDTETGEARLVRYVAVDDVGTVVNPLIVDGQVHGGITQGIATALYEEAIYDEDGNLANGNLATYLLPSAAELPSYELERTESKATDHPFGAKGVGETGTIAAAPAVINAVLDALSHLGVTDIQMPATPERVWRAIEEARQ
ncbi:Aerobic-type carbon monoxide dehydrogenase large subunit CoxL/CutL-like protein [Gaiella occulta]|uniref:Aerobic-type carbon monoxide dehydrogenase large subunit CoxL/CutL-like protein n=1 Tax=Gaiella occulta TaxID=1002870 RepID=A0A7M2YTD4_9ACTN|nr:xanthine dehydrogenase family protein molybdopterin-binding subunit [Gaiella occulta]RDI73346.1 Aerobic-type carbon monoxide dehydrogenase large subunit CoxL/CutL-like protein [Gaiella occulta]